MNTRTMTAPRALALCLLVTSYNALASDESRFGLELETGGVWFSRNDVRVPGDTGTRFDMLDLTGNGPDAFFRLYGSWNINQRHGLRIGIAPLEVSGTGDLKEDTQFAGTSFDAGRTKGTYKFSTYTLTYRYTFASSPKSLWRIGFTGLVRDAKIQLEQEGRKASDSNTGFVPLLHLDGRYRFANRWNFVLDFDGLASSQGRALDLALKVLYDVGKHWEVGGGYRTLEGGADNDEVYNFAWLHYAVASVGYKF